jgi:hypothetical protein
MITLKLSHIIEILILRLFLRTDKNGSGMKQFCQLNEADCTFYQRPGRPERAMAEIRRMLLQKISDQIQKERSSAASLKKPLVASDSTQRNEIKYL